MKVVDIKPKGKQEKYIVHFENGEEYVLMLECIVKNHIKRGTLIDSIEFETALLDSQNKMSFDCALKYITSGIKSQLQVINKLKEKGFPTSVIDDTIEKLNRYKYLDDKTFAKAYVTNYKSSKGEKMLKYELKTKGISDSIISQVTDSIEQQEDVNNLAKKYMKNKDSTKENIVKLYRFILSRGFSYDQAKKTIDVIGEKNEDWD